MPNPAQETRPSSALATAKADIKRLTHWALIVLVLSVWPFLSVMPLFSLIHALGDGWNIGVRLAFLGTGFWSFAALLGIVEWVRIKPHPDTFAAVRQRLLPRVAAFGAVWIVSYGAARYLGYA